MKKKWLVLFSALALVGCMKHDRMSSQPYAWKMDISANTSQRLKNIEKRIKALEVDIEFARESEDRFIYNRSFTEQRHKRKKLKLFEKELQELKSEQETLLSKP
jgi:hypothetical protein